MLSDQIITVEPKPPKPGDYAWYAMSAGIFLYDMFAIKTKKCETMSSAIWRSLNHPIKAPTTVLIWLAITHHLFGTKKARTAYSVHIRRRKV
jgi:hypothetical protein